MVGARGSCRVLGIDPGLTRLGYGVVEEARGKLTELAAGTFETSPEMAAPARLLLTFERLTELIAHWAPDAVAVERVFFKVNARTAVPAMQAAGVALLAAARSRTDVYEYPPLEVKRGIAGTGTATKEQVRFMVDQLVGSRRSSAAGAGERRRGPDTTDALAVAICHLHARRLKAIGGMEGIAGASVGALSRTAAAGLEVPLESGQPRSAGSGARDRPGLQEVVRGGSNGGMQEGLREAIERAVRRDARQGSGEIVGKARQGGGR
jgi:crossover junction endodeoxyribonuclease RuvC